MVMNGDGDCNSHPCTWGGPGRCPVWWCYCSADEAKHLSTLFWIQSPSTRPQKMTLLNLEVQDSFIFGPFTTATGCFLMILMPQSLTGHRWCHEWIGSSATRCRVFQFLLPTGAVFESDWGDLKGTSVLTREIPRGFFQSWSGLCTFSIWNLSDFLIRKDDLKNHKSLTQNLWSMMLSKTRISSFWPLFRGLSEVFKGVGVAVLQYGNMVVTCLFC